ncbi:protein ecdysoneless homolog [Cynara cardunculus var. scolymus]|uniref:protein ecdysoneless homolog n=1 Tax=Cynara cardunculus var. scolymus TaxID=59895 RepID=UPI000D62AFE3|nr:protein ecdysoneless homolog [Cynara cardunculus var. scolymus]XP_024992721.1 protein ecdysoneless homolog [Cynara cardunculus var. scolymus]XP_024992729.1 protein ecdysoneless homolog [Cynara cardunculus var. scolymus]
MSEADPSSIFSQKNSRLPEDTVFFSIFPDFSLSSDLKYQNSKTDPLLSSQLQCLHLQILQTLSCYTTSYIWQHEPFSLSLSTQASCAFCPSSSNQFPHLHGKLRYGDNLEDEWFVVFLLFEISCKFPNLSIRVWDTDGEFLLIEAAFHLPKWLNPETSTNRIFIRGGNLHIVPNNHFPSVPTLFDALLYVMKCEDKTKASSSVQLAIKHRIGDYPDRAIKNMHRVRVQVPALVAHVLKHEPCLISLAVEGFYDRDIDSMKYAANMERFLPNKSADEIVEVTVMMSRAMYAQLMQQTFQAPKCYPMPTRSDSGYAAAELGMKIACGFEMIYQVRKREVLEGKGSSWEVYRESLDRSGYFEGLLPGSKEYKRLMENAEDYYRKSSLHSRESEIMSAPVRRIDDILAHPFSADDFKGKEVPPSDDDLWLYNGEDELNAALLERQQEMEHYDLNRKKNKKSKEQEDVGPSSSSNIDDYDLGDIAKSMQAFIQKMSSFEGAEVPGDRNPNNVDLDVERFMKEIESVMKTPNAEHADDDDDDDVDEDLSSDMDLDDSEDSDIGEVSDDHEDEQTAFMSSYSDALSEELKSTTLGKSFVRANEPTFKKDEGTSNAAGDVQDEFTHVDVDVNLVKSFLGSFSSQEGLPGPASNLLGLMGLQLPQDDKTDK